MTLVEIAVQDAAGAAVAFGGGADRIELCQALAETGGLTPSLGTFDTVAETDGSAARVAVLVRSRPGGFVYDDAEVEVMARDVATFVARGAGSVVVGALRADGAVDVDAVRCWQDAAGEAEVVFHRALDVAPDPVAALEVLADLGITRVLTSGGAARSIDGLATLEALVVASGGRVQIQSGGGVRVQDIRALIGAGVDAVHLSARAASGDTAPSGPGGGPAGFDVTDPSIVAAAVAAARA